MWIMRSWAVSLEEEPENQEVKNTNIQEEELQDHLDEMQQMINELMEAQELSAISNDSELIQIIKSEVKKNKSAVIFM